MGLPHGIAGLVPDEYVGYTYIAGGYAACAERASDIDVWVLVGDSEPLDQARQKLLDYLQKDFLYDELDANIEVGDNYEGIEIAIQKVAYIPYHPLPVHLMVTNAPIIEALLANFDISTHQVAIGPNGDMFCGPHWTPLTAMPVVLIDTPTTQSRLARFTDRYADFRKVEQLA